MPAFTVAVALNVPSQLNQGLEVFWTTNAGSVQHMFQAVRNGAWSSQAYLGGGPPSMQYIAVGQNAPDGRLELFGCTSHGSLYHVWQKIAGDGNSWTPEWTPLGSGTSVEQPVLSRHFGLPGGSLPFDGVDAAGQLELFADNKEFGTDPGDVNQIMQIGQGGQVGNWTGWNDIGANFGPPWTVAQNVDGTLEVFTIQASFDVFFNRQASPAPESGFLGFNGFFLGLPTPGMVQIEVGINGDPSGITGGLELFGLDSNGDLFLSSQQVAGDDASWTQWEQIGNTPQGGIQQITVGQNSDGHLEVFGRDAENHPWHQWQFLVAQEQPFPFSNWQPLGWDLSQPATAPAVGDLVVGHNGDGRLEVFSRNDDDTGQHTWQDPNNEFEGPNFGGWVGWSSLWQAP